MLHTHVASGGATENKRCDEITTPAFYGIENELMKTRIKNPASPAGRYFQREADCVGDLNNNTQPTTA